ncbi:hypothetical protein ASPFODRAFT_596814 [Aspergillus luchuensis CBS 106.47]|uniref:Uncharacterized protein n=1 Tax=Aspergillus luchuensis (strain CBS 106.47) TaxID=1137211 RepID=A0A1M3THT1_ASPLC|nr:hypothetical protein ASPFODRAFT_596814 [Aspergillus luchuensis CBS 106.47]
MAWNGVGLVKSVGYVYMKQTGTFHQYHFTIHTYIQHIYTSFLVYIQTYKHMTYYNPRLNLPLSQYIPMTKY